MCIQWNKINFTLTPLATRSECAFASQLRIAMYRVETQTKCKQRDKGNVYSHLRDEHSRATDVIVSGRPTSSNCPDQKIVTDL